MRAAKLWNFLRKYQRAREDEMGGKKKSLDFQILIISSIKNMVCSLDVCGEREKSGKHRKSLISDSVNQINFTKIIINTVYYCKHPIRAR